MSTKLLVFADPVKKTVGRSFVVPDIVGTKPNGFVGLERALTIRFAMVAYTAAEVSSEEFFDRFWVSASRQPRPDALQVLGTFLERVQSFKIGNVLSIDYHECGGLELRKEAQRMLADETPKLRTWRAARANFKSQGRRLSAARVSGRMGAGVESAPPCAHRPAATG